MRLRPQLLVLFLLGSAFVALASESELDFELHDVFADDALAQAGSADMSTLRSRARESEAQLQSVGVGGRVSEMSRQWINMLNRNKNTHVHALSANEGKTHADQVEAAGQSGEAALASDGQRGQAQETTQSQETQSFVKDAEARVEEDLQRTEREDADGVRMVEEQSDAKLREGIQAAEQQELDTNAAIKRKEEEEEIKLKAKEEETIKAMVAKEEEMEKKLRSAMYEMGKARLEGEQASEEHLKDEISKVQDERKTVESLEKESTTSIKTSASTVQAQLQEKLAASQTEREQLQTEERAARQAEALLVRQQRAAALNAAMTKEAMLARRRAELAIQREAQIIALHADKQRARAQTEKTFAPMAVDETYAHDPAAVMEPRSGSDAPELTNVADGAAVAFHDTLARDPMQTDAALPEQVPQQA